MAIPQPVVSPSTSVLQSLQRLVDAAVLEADPAQARLAGLLDDLCARLLAARRTLAGDRISRLLKKNSGSPGLRGIFIHGGVGRGKSMLADMFFAIAPEPAKRRVHFNEFMQEVHERIHLYRQEFKAGRTNAKDPLAPVAKAIAGRARLLCFDEFAVSDIADAMILGRLFSHLFEAGVCVVATSNSAPDELYRDGLNRQLFLPFVELLKRHAPPFALDARMDFRLGKTPRNRAYLSPLLPVTTAVLDEIWREVMADRREISTRIALKGRKFEVRRMAGRAARFGFAELCSEARGPEDYLALASRFEFIMIEGVPMMDLARRNEAKRFIQLIDTLYDRNVRVVVSAAAGPHALYSAPSGIERTEFQRTASRLIEMQSTDWRQRRNIFAT